MKFFHNESAFLKLTAGLEPRQHILFDGIRYALSLIELSFNRLYGSLHEISKEKQGVDLQQHYYSVFSDAWSIVDSANRLQGLVKSIEGYQYSPAISDFLVHNESGRNLRNHVQHLNSNLDRLVKLKQPIMGWITWVACLDAEKDRIYSRMISAGSLANGKMEIQNPVGKVIQPPVDLIRLHADRHSVDLSELVDRVSAVSHFLESKLATTVEHTPAHVTDLQLVVVFESK